MDDFRWDLFYNNTSREARRVLSCKTLTSKQANAIHVLMDELAWIVCETMPWPIGYSEPIAEEATTAIRELAEVLQSNRKRRAYEAKRPYSAYPLQRPENTAEIINFRGAPPGSSASPPMIDTDTPPPESK